MSEAGGSGNAGGSGFGLGTTLALVVGGALLFVALLWMIGTGVDGNTGNDGGAHVGGRGLNGFAGFAKYLEARGFTVRRSQSKSALAEPGLLVLTPPTEADGKALDAIVAHRRYIGPTLVILPKWRTGPITAANSDAKPGWVRLDGTSPPIWRGFLDGVTIAVAPSHGGWSGLGTRGTLPAPQVVLGAGPSNLVPLVRTGDGRPLAGYIPDRGYYPALAAAAGVSARPVATDDDDEEGGETQPNQSIYPLVLLIEPDLVDNYGLRDGADAILAERLVRTVMRDAALRPGAGAKTGSDPATTVVFDMTLNGFNRSPNLLTLAFTPPFLAATLCLLLAALAAGWRAFVRFGAPRREDRAIAFGKRALVANTAGLIERSGRLHLLAEPYAARTRDRLVRALGLPRGAGIAETDAAVDRALMRRRRGALGATGEAGEQPPFSVLVARLGGARRRQDMLAAAEALHTLERTLTR
jgi:hypothetical protein